jgi:geranyl-CoA carboxylase alpha subunit
MGQAAVNAAKACDYVGAGTVEFLVDADKNFYFLEMNTRLQVEPPGTERVTGLDLVELQLTGASGEPLPITQEQVELIGHAIEVRIYAEDPRDNFVPQSGRVLSWKPSTEARIDSGICQGQTISPYYDPMLAKVITWSDTREQAITKLANALVDTELLGVNNNIRFLADVVSRKAFSDGDATTAFLAQQYPGENYQRAKPEAITSAIAGLLFFRESQLGHSNYERHWRRAVAMMSQYKLRFNDDEYPVSISFDQGIYRAAVASEQFEFTNVVSQSGRCSMELRGHRLNVNFIHLDECLHMQHELASYTYKDASYAPASSVSSAGDEHVRAAMDGAIVDIKVAKGDHVKAGDVVAILEAMKMAHQLKASIDGIVDQVSIEIGQQVKARQILVTTVEAV